MQHFAPGSGGGTGVNVLRRITWLLMAVTLSLPTLVGAEEPALVLGLHPNISARTVIDMYQPLRQYLEQALKRPVQLYTAPDFQTYVQRTLKGEYDVAVTAPHLAHMAQRAGYVTLFHYAKELKGVIIVAKDSPIKDVTDLRGKTVALPDPLTIISIMGIEYLRAHQLVAGRDVNLFSARSHNNAAIAVERAQVAAAIIGSVPYEQLPAALRAQLRIIAETESVPSQFIIAAERLPAAVRERVRTALTEFAATDGGRQWLDTNGFGGLKPATADALRRLAPYSKAAEAMLERGDAKAP